MITDLIFSDVRAVILWITRTKEAVLPPKPVHIPSEWTSFIELIFTLFLLYVILYSMYDAFRKARKNYLDNIKSPVWRKNSRIEYDQKTINAVHQISFLRSIVPRHGPMNVILIGEVLSYLFIGYGLIGVATILYALFCFVLQPALQRRRTPGDPQWASEAPDASIGHAGFIDRPDLSKAGGEDRR